MQFEQVGWLTVQVPRCCGLAGAQRCDSGDLCDAYAVVSRSRTAITFNH